MNILRAIAFGLLLLLPVSARSNLTLVFCSQWQFGHLSPMLPLGEQHMPFLQYAYIIIMMRARHIHAAAEAARRGHDVHFCLPTSEHDSASASLAELYGRLHLDNRVVLPLFRFVWVTLA
jgi:hypothetical protein